MKIEWVEDKFADLSGEEGAFNVAADKNNRKPARPKKMVPMYRTCHGDLAKVPSCTMGHLM
jgi:hypothetical protein